MGGGEPGDDALAGAEGALRRPEFHGVRRGASLGRPNDTGSNAASNRLDSDSDAAKGTHLAQTTVIAMSMLPLKALE